MHDGYLKLIPSPRMGKKITGAPHKSYPTHTTKVKPQKSLDQTEILLTLEEPFPKPSHHEFRAFRDWLILALDEAKAITA